MQLMLGQGQGVAVLAHGRRYRRRRSPIWSTTCFGEAVLDGELLVGARLRAGAVQRSAAAAEPQGGDAPSWSSEYPAFIRVYDMLFDGREDIRALPWTERRAQLEAWFADNPQTRLDLSRGAAVRRLGRAGARCGGRGADEHGHEGVMVKLRTSPYVPGRPKGLWFKWKRDPNVVDAILMYAQRGHGKRSSFYSDYTFGVWKGNEIVPIGKAYFGFTDEELKQLDKWVRNNTVQAFGPVREVRKELVFEVAFDSAQQSRRGTSRAWRCAFRASTASAGTSRRARPRRWRTCRCSCGAT